MTTGREGVLPDCAFCGHPRSHHIYDEGACRGGYICGSNCTAYAAPVPSRYRRVRAVGLTWDWRKWGLGGSIDWQREQIGLRFWVGPFRFGTCYVRQAVPHG